MTKIPGDPPPDRRRRASPETGGRRRPTALAAALIAAPLSFLVTGALVWAGLPLLFAIPVYGLIGAVILGAVILLS